MKRSLLLPPALALVGLAVSCLLLWTQTMQFKRSVENIAEGARVSLIDMEGKVAYDSTGQDLPNHSDRAEFEAVKADGRERSVVRESETLHMAMFYHARRAGDYVLRIAVPYQAVADAKSSAAYGLLAAIGTGALVILALFLCTRRYEQRLSRLAAERDMQERLLAEMRKLEEFRRDFLSNVAHEFKTPVTGMLGAVEVLADEGPGLDESDRRELRGVLKDQAVRLDALVEDVLSLSRLEKAEADHATVFAPCDIVDVVQTAVNLARPQARKAGVAMDVVRRPAVSGRRALIRPCDPRLIESAVANLLQNAIRHSGSRSVEVVVEETPEGKASIRVIDHGVGIPTECHSRLFERFYRVDKDRSRTVGGTGLGLAIVKHIVHLHGGEVSVASKPGAGSTFRIVL